MKYVATRKWLYDAAAILMQFCHWEISNNRLEKTMRYAQMMYNQSYSDGTGNVYAL